MVSPNDIKQWIEAGLPGSVVECQGDGRHFQARVIWEGFTGKNKVQQHQAVYGVLGTKMREEIHALSLFTAIIQEADSE